MTKREATARGKKLLKKMKGKGWKLRVHENIGWHFNVWNGPIAVHDSGDGIYWCLMGTAADCLGVACGHMDWSDNFHNKDPNKVVEHQVRIARKVVDGMGAVIELVEAIGGS